MSKTVLIRSKLTSTKTKNKIGEDHAALQFTELEIFLAVLLKEKKESDSILVISKQVHILIF